MHTLIGKPCTFTVPDLGESLPGRNREDADVDGPTSFQGLVSEAKEKADTE